MTTDHDKSTNPSVSTATETLDAGAGAVATTPHTIATGYEGSVRDQIDHYIQRVRGGEMGMLPALGGLVVLSLLFWAATPFFFTKTNIANLLTQTAALMMLAVALTFVIILAEIDLSAGVTGGLGMAIFILLTNLGGWNWILALLVSFAVGAAIGTFIGFFVARIGVPSFVITLALFLGLQGVILVLLGNAGAYRIEEPAVRAIMNRSMPVWAGWALLAIIVVISLITGLYDRSRRQATGMPVRPMSLLLARVAAWVVGGGFVVLLLSLNRSTSVIPIRGVPIVVPIALLILYVGTVMLDRTRFGLHLYAVGGNPEGGPARGHQRGSGADGGLHPLLVLGCRFRTVHGQSGRHRRVLRRSRHRAERRGRRGGRRGQPLRWPGPPGPGGGRGTADLDDHQRARAARPVGRHHAGDHRWGPRPGRYG